MQKSKQQSIITTTASTAGVMRGSKATNAYTSSKHAACVMTEEFASGYVYINFYTFPSLSIYIYILSNTHTHITLFVYICVIYIYIHYAHKHMYARYTQIY